MENKTKFPVLFSLTEIKDFVEKAQKETKKAKATAKNPNYLKNQSIGLIHICPEEMEEFLNSVLVPFYEKFCL
jgi:hypothetical protein